MMTCRELAELLLEFIADELEADRCSQIHEHLHACPHCEVFVQTYRLTIRITRQLPCEEMPDRLRSLCDELLRRHADS